MAAFIFTANINGPDIITGGSFGPEASVIALLLGTIISAFFLWKILQPIQAATLQGGRSSNE
ncbi:MAG: hypothetical protein MJY97_07630 [Bacteroidales bacterium]|nr:hypothetical protein [Bacteroidales bacterium]